LPPPAFQVFMSVYTYDTKSLMTSIVTENQW